MRMAKDGHAVTILAVDAVFGASLQIEVAKNEGEFRISFFLIHISFLGKRDDADRICQEAQAALANAERAAQGVHKAAEEAARIQSDGYCCSLAPS